MMKEEVIVTRIAITSPGEVRNFQVNLPADTRRIIGVELGAFRAFYAQTGNYYDPEWWSFSNANDPLFQVKPSKTVGDCTLQTPGIENIFFRGEMKDKDSNVFWTDFTRPLMNQFSEWTHSRRREAMELNVDGNSIVEGCFKDQWGVLNALFVSYTFHIYLWIEKK